MEIQEYLNQKIHLQKILLEYIKNDNQEYFLQLTNLLDLQNFHENHQELKAFLHLLSKISKNHHHNPNFFQKIEQIILHIEKDIKQFFTNADIFQIFKNCKRILLFLIENKILILEEPVISYIHDKKSHNFRYCHYFFPELKQHISNEELESIKNELINYDPKVFDNFCEKRKTGENETYICSLIRNDSINKFIKYLNETKISISSSIKVSIFETNSFLLDKEPSLIEYAAFFGSINIFEYLITNNIELTPSLYLYSIHSNNQNFVNKLLEKLEDRKIIEKCYIEAIKCHNNEIADYIKTKNNFDDDNLSYSFHYYNYAFLPKSFNENKFIFYHLCQYSYYKIVKILLNLDEKEFKMNEILNIFFLNNDYFNAMKCAASKNNYDIVQLLLSQKEIEIKANAFNKCKKLRELSIPSTVNKIGNSSFFECINLSKITLPSSIMSIEDNAFYGCSSLTEITIPSSMTIIKKGTFKGCLSIKKVTIPSSITKIEDFAFYDCSSLINILLPPSITSIGNFSFCKCSSLKELSIPSSVTFIGQNSFSLCSSLVKVTIPSSINTINDFAFSLCSSLKQITLPDSLTSIGNRSFNGCKSLINIEIPSSVNSIDERAFYDCISLSEITIPNSVTSIKKFCFSGCSSLKTINIPSSVSVIEDFAFEGCIKLERIALPSKIKIINQNVFCGCESLFELTIPDSVRSIGTSAFENCYSLSQISLSQSLKSIGNYCFKNCESLEEIYFPEYFRSIGLNAFEGCISLAYVSVPFSIQLDETGIDENIEIDRF